jgi:hypothetical protein
MSEIDDRIRISTQNRYLSPDDEILYEDFRNLFALDKDENILHICRSRGVDVQQDISIEKDIKNDRLFDNMCPCWQLAPPDVRYMTKHENLCAELKVIELKVDIHRPQMARKRSVIVLQLHLRK